MSAQLQVVVNNKADMEITTIATAAVLAELNISVWTAKKKDKRTSDEVRDDKNVKADKAVSVYKNLFADDKDLKAIMAYQTSIRMYFVRHTLPWNDLGCRLMPARSILDVTNELEAMKQQFFVYVNAFISAYPGKINVAAFKLGQLFNRDDFPSVDEVRRKFAMNYVLTPVPTSGDFRVDVQNDVGEFLKNKYKTDAEQRIAALLRDPWERAYESLRHMQARIDALLQYDDTLPGGRPRLHQTVFDNALELAGLLDKLNVTNDAQLSDCATRIRRLVTGVDVQVIREDKTQQTALKKKVDDLMSAFDFSGFVDE